MNVLVLGSGSIAQKHIKNLVLGFIFSEQILKIYNNVDNKLFAEQTKKLIGTHYISNLIKNLNSKINKIKFNVLDYTNWIVVHDNSANSLNALELRIECTEGALRYQNSASFSGDEKIDYVTNEEIKTLSTLKLILRFSIRFEILQ